VSSCANGHPVSPGAESCAVCGDDVRPRCYQGHRSAAGSRFCETCGAMLAAEPAAGAADLPAADLVTEYTSRPFNEFLIEDAGETGDDGAPPRPDATAVDAVASPGSVAAPASAAAAASAGSAAAPPGSADPASAAAAASAGSAAAPPGSADPASAVAAASAGSAAAPPGSADPASAHGRPRSRTLTAALGAAVLTAAGVAGGLTLHQRTGQQPQAGPSLGRAPTAAAAVLPTAPAAGPPTVPATIAPTAPTAPTRRPRCRRLRRLPIAPTAPSAPTAPASGAPTAPAVVAAPAPFAPAPAAPAAPASALPTSSPMPALTVVPAWRTARASIKQWAGWIGRRDQYQGPQAGEHDPLRDWQPQQSGERWPGRGEWPGVRWGGPPDRSGPDGGPQQRPRDGFRQR